MRLDRYLTDAGVCSRRECASLIRRGRVKVNGVRAKSGSDRVTPDADAVEVDGGQVAYSRHHYIMMNKPAGVVSATEDSKEKTVADLLEGRYARLGLFPAGRLDKDAEGLLLLTDDGDFAHRVISPKKKVYKRYYVEVSGSLDEDDCAAFASGVTLRDGTTFLPGRLEIISSGETSCCHVIICEGKFHQVKRMLAALGKPVAYLRRVAIGGLQIDENLIPGGYRDLSEEELEMVFSADDDR